MFKPVHHVPGRLRLQSAAVKGSPAEAAAVQSRVSAVPGVRQVECRALTGSVIVHYDPAVVEASAVLSELGYRDTVSEVVKCPVSRGIHRRKTAAQRYSSHLAQKALRGLLWFALENAAERALPALITAVL